jgi:cell division transport system permease protein
MWLNLTEFLIGQASAAIRRNPLMTIAAITNVAVALAILGTFALVALNLNHMAGLEAQAAVITCELSGKVPASDVEAALLADARVRETKFVSKAEALQQIAEKNKLDLSSLKLLPNPLPDSIIVRPRDPADIASVRDAASHVAGVEQARYPQQVTNRILTVARGVKLAALLIGTLLVLACLTVVSTTIRLTIYARRREIRIMQLVGATQWFIRLPFLLEGLFHGVVGGAVAAAIVVSAYGWLHDYVGENLQFITVVYDMRTLAITAAALVLCGALFGAVGSLAGLRRYLQIV